MNDFKNIAESLSSLLDIENHLLFKMGEISAENIAGYKLKLLENLEENLSDEALEAFDQDDLKCLKTVKKKIYLNKKLQQARNLQIKAVSDVETNIWAHIRPEKEEEKKCH